MFPKRRRQSSVFSNILGNFFLLKTKINLNTQPCSQLLLCKQEKMWVKKTMVVSRYGLHGIGMDGKEGRRLVWEQKR